MPRSFSGKDIRFSLWQQGFDSPTGYHHNQKGRIAQLGEHLPYKQGVIGSSPIVTTNLITIVGGVAQLVRAPACHAGGREFDPRHSRHELKSTRHTVVCLFFIKKA